MFWANGGSYWLEITHAAKFYKCFGGRDNNILTATAQPQPGITNQYYGVFDEDIMITYIHQLLLVWACSDQSLPNINELVVIRHLTDYKRSDQDSAINPLPPTLQITT